MTNVQIKRIYEQAEKSDGYRVLVDRLWPRGLKKEDAHIDEWVKEVAPSTILRKWFNHEPEKWAEFRVKYTHELEGNKAVERLLDDVKSSKKATLLYGAHDKEHNQAVVLKEFLVKYIK